MLCWLSIKIRQLGLVFLCTARCNMLRDWFECTLCRAAVCQIIYRLSAALQDIVADAGLLSRQAVGLLLQSVAWP